MKRRTIAHLLRKAQRHPVGSQLHRSYTDQLLAEMHRCAPPYTDPDGMRPAPALVSRAFGERLRRRHRIYNAMMWFGEAEPTSSWTVPTISSADVRKDLEELCGVLTSTRPVSAV